jgi:hypothetical protein
MKSTFIYEIKTTLLRLFRKSVSWPTGSREMGSGAPRFGLREERYGQVPGGSVTERLPVLLAGAIS